jgi:hypothetical protein
MTVNSTSHFLEPSHTYITRIITLFFFFSSEEKTIKIAKNVAASKMHKMLTQAEYYPS